jgi:hypothetical protein
MVKFVIRVTYSPTGANEGGFETAVLVGQASCLSFLDRPEDEAVSKPENRV